ncbi:MAG: hypothetical protein IH914_11060, partial [candidate division Zixibacteria bacterium]|nr:hypothetical protein [candidate division Zixibacteria bacterium]
MWRIHLIPEPGLCLQFSSDGEALAAAGHRVVDYAIVPDEPDQIAERVRRLVDDADCRAILLTGGTGLSPRDSTFEVVDGLLEKRLDGFGE